MSFLPALALDFLRTRMMTVDEFDAALDKATDWVDFGPLRGFAGQGANDVYANLPPEVVKAFRALKVPVPILAGPNPGKLVRDYAEACGKDVERILRRFKCPVKVEG
jgi:hypothetical protein